MPYDRWTMPSKGRGEGGAMIIAERNGAVQGITGTQGTFWSSICATTGHQDLSAA